jgi:hypothetical protein
MPCLGDHFSIFFPFTPFIKPLLELHLCIRERHHIGVWSVDKGGFERAPHDMFGLFM